MSKTQIMDRLLGMQSGILFGRSEQVG